MPMLITNQGWDVINNAGLAGPRTNLTQFKVIELDAPTYAAYTPAATDTETHLITTLGGIAQHTGTVTDYDILSATEIRFTCSMGPAVGSFNYNVLVMYHEDPGAPGIYTMFAVYKMTTTVPKTASAGPVLGDTQDLIAHFVEGQLVGTINYTISNTKLTYNFVPEVNDLASLPIAEDTGSRLYRLTREEGAGGSGVNTYFVHAAGVTFAPEAYQNNEWVPESHSLVWDADNLQIVVASGGGFTTTTTTIVVSTAEVSPLASTRIPQPYNALVASFFEVTDANQGFIRNVTAVDTNVSAGTEYIRFTLSSALDNAPTVGAQVKLWCPAGTASGASGGVSGYIGQSVAYEATATDSGDGYQYVLSTGTARAANSFLFAAPGFIPDSKYNVTGTNQITLSAGNGIPVGVKYQVVERSRSVIEGGTIGQVLTKNSSTDGDYSWQTSAGKSRIGPFEATGTANALAITTGGTTLVDGLIVEVIAKLNNTAGTMTIALDGGAAIPIRSRTGYATHSAGVMKGNNTGAAADIITELEYYDGSFRFREFTRRITSAFSSGSFAVPYHVNMVYLTGMGGGGGGANTTGGGSSGGSFCLKHPMEVTPGASVPYVIGAGGTTGNGGDTTFNSVVIAYGGRANAGAYGSAGISGMTKDGVIIYAGAAGVNQSVSSNDGENSIFGGTGGNGGVGPGGAGGGGGGAGLGNGGAGGNGYNFAGHSSGGNAGIGGGGGGCGIDVGAGNSVAHGRGGAGFLYIEWDQ